MFQTQQTHATACGWTTAATTYKHVIWIWYENKDSSKITTTSAPYFKTVAAQCASLTNVQDTGTMPSLNSEPQYAAATSGSNCDGGITTSSGAGTGCILTDGTGGSGGNQLSTKSIFQLVKENGGTWKSYQESMETNCQQSNASGPYRFKHNPAAFYTPIRSDCNTLDVPIAAVTCPDIANNTCSTPNNVFVSDINAGKLPTYSFVTPNLDNDMHDGSIQQGDNWLHTYLPLIVAGPNYQAGDTAVFIMWDEGSSGTGTPIIPTTVIAPTIPTGTVVSTAVNNIGLLKTTQDALGLTPYLGCASGTPPSGGTGTCNPGSNVSLKTALHL
jgi:hypothetical protein